MNKGKTTEIVEVDPKQSKIEFLKTDGVSQMEAHSHFFLKKAPLLCF